MKPDVECKEWFI